MRFVSVAPSIRLLRYRALALLVLLALSGCGGVDVPASAPSVPVALPPTAMPPLRQATIQPTPTIAPTKQPATIQPAPTIVPTQMLATTPPTPTVAPATPTVAATALPPTATSVPAVPSAVATDVSCLPDGVALPEAPVAPPAAPDSPQTAPLAPPESTYEIVRTYPHDRSAFTEGLIYVDGTLYEGTGLNGRSMLRQVDLATGAIIRNCALPQAFFGEGITIFGDKLIQLTWQTHVGFVYAKDSFVLLRTFSYPTEGWGITHDGARLIMSDGTPTIHFLDPETLQETGHIEVYDNNGPVTRLNELEYIHGEIYANVWQTDRIARISPQTGQVLGWIDLSGLLSAEDRTQPVDVLNGIAYDPQGARLFVTGKLWPKLFEIKLKPAPG